MKYRFFSFSSVLGVAVALASCTPSGDLPLYSWYGYADAQYQYVNKPSAEAREKLRCEYINMWVGQKAQRKVVPPGLSADYGLLLYREGNREDGLSYLRKEAELYPEAKTYVERLIKKLEEGK